MLTHLHGAACDVAEPSARKAPRVQSRNLLHSESTASLRLRPWPPRRTTKPEGPQRIGAALGPVCPVAVATRGLSNGTVAHSRLRPKQTKTQGWVQIRQQTQMRRRIVNKYKDTNIAASKSRTRTRHALFCTYLLYILLHPRCGVRFKVNRTSYGSRSHSLPQNSVKNAVKRLKAKPQKTYLSCILGCCNVWS